MKQGSPRRRSTPFVLTKIGQLWKLVRESHAEPMTGEPQKPVLVPNNAAAVTFIGHSSFLLQIAGKNVLIDPVFAKRLVVLRRQRHVGVLVRDLPRIDAILLTHAHMDHLNLPSLRGVVREMRRRHQPAPIAIVPKNVSDLLKGIAFAEVRELSWWESTALGPLTMTATPAKHWGARMFSDTHRGFGGYTLAAEGQPTIWHSGDTAYFNGFHEIGNRLHPDIALLPIGAYFPDTYRAVHTSPEEALQAFLDVGAAAMIPMHFGTFRLGREPMDEPLPRLLAAAEERGVDKLMHPLAEGETLTLEATPSRAEHSSPEFALAG